VNRGKRGIKRSMAVWEAHSSRSAARAVYCSTRTVYLLFCESLKRLPPTKRSKPPKEVVAIVCEQRAFEEGD
jgi:hypothetical protein